jgi:LPS-assembly protein
MLQKRQPGQQAVNQTTVGHPATGAGALYNRRMGSRGWRRWVSRVALLGLMAAAAPAACAQQSRAAFVELEADRQSKSGSVYHAEGRVRLRYGPLVLETERLDYDEQTGKVDAPTRLVLTDGQRRIEAARGWMNLRTGRGEFMHVRGSVRVPRRENPELLVTQNPLSFAAERLERLDADTYVVHHAWLTVCDAAHPFWRFYAVRAVVRLDRSARMRGVSFRIFSVPLLYLPYATLPLGRNVRQSGLLVPDAGHSSLKGFVAGDSYYWAVTDWLDLTLGAQYLSRRGWSQLAGLRATPAAGTHFAASYFGVDDRGLPGPGGQRVSHSGYELHAEADAPLGNGWRLAADINQLSSLGFRLAFAETFSQAVNPEVSSAVAVERSVDGWSFAVAGVQYKNFLSLTPEQSIVLRRAPEVRMETADRPLAMRWPIYWSWHAFADALHRDISGEPQAETGPAVQRFELAPSVTVPLRWGPWLGLTPTLQVRATHYGAQQTPDGHVVNSGLDRVTEEFTLDVRPPSLARDWGTAEAGWEHTIEPQIVYRRVAGVNDFGRFLRFDEDDTITDTDEVEYSLTQRLYRRDNGAVSELLSWQVAQKYFFDPSFGGALVPGRRNVFAALDALTAFAFASGPRHLSPVVSDLRLTPGGRWDVEFRGDFDPERGRPTVLGTLVKMRPWRESFLTLAHFALRGDPVLQPRSNQLRAQVGWGELNRRGLNVSFGVTYDARQALMQNQIAQFSYNGSCCGLAFEYRRLALGPVRTENQFRLSLLVANLGTFGNLRRRERIF